MPRDNETTTRFKVDISELKKNISDAQRQIRLANAEFKAAAAGMDNWQTSTNGITAKLSQLRTVLTSQKTVLDSLKAQYAQVAAEQGENSKGAQELAIKIANQQAAVNKTEKALADYTAELKDVQKAEDLAARNGKSVEENLKELGDQSQKTADDVKKSSDGFTVLKGALANLAAQGIQVAIGAMKDLAKETWESVKAAAAYADEVNTLSAQTGISTEKLQEFKYMEDLIDVSTETMTGSMAKLIRNMANAQKGSGDASAAFEALGISVTDANGELRSNQDVFNEAIDALGRMENETQRDAYAMQIFGKSAQDLNPLIEAGGDKIAQLTQEAHEMGYVLGDETLNSLNETQDALDRFSKVAEGAKNGIVAAFGPTVTKIFGDLSGVVQKLPEAFKTGDFSGVLDSVGEVFHGFIDQAKESAPEFIRSGLSMVRQLAVGILNETPAMAETAAEVATALIEGLTEEAPKLLEAIPPVLQQLVAVLLKSAPELIKAGNGLMLALAKSFIAAIPVFLAGLPGFIQQVVTQIKSLLPELLNTGTELLLAILQGLLDALPALLEALPTVIDAAAEVLETGLPLIIDAAVQLFMGIIEALPTITQLLIQTLPGLVTTATNLLVKSLPLILDAAVKMLMGIIDALPIIIRLMVADLPMLIQAITTTLIANLPLILAAGVELLTGVVTAIPKVAIELVKKAPELVTAIIEGIMSSFDSMKTAGEDLIEGLWEGISGAKDWIKGKLTGWVGDVTGFLKDLFGIASPSKLMETEIGQYIAKGVAVGITDNVKDVKAAMTNLVKEAAGVPIELGDVKLHAASGMNMNGAAATVSGGVVNNTYNTFNQTNNSPKALNRLEIYRQTRNQFRFATGG